MRDLEETRELRRPGEVTMTRAGGNPAGRESLWTGLDAVVPHEKRGLVGHAALRPPEAGPPELPEHITARRSAACDALPRAWARVRQALEAWESPGHMQSP
ncbi:hypothetical protein JXA88_08825 [Candidatus Fermentibacteria bacterium]|nr:hypothetical protein [Candidatus Fermentibacteria bacterium]